MIQLTLLNSEKKLFNPDCISRIEPRTGNTADVYVGNTYFSVSESANWIRKRVVAAPPAVRPMTDKEIKAGETVTILRSEYERLKKDAAWLAELEAAGIDNSDAYQYACDLRRERGIEDED